MPKYQIDSNISKVRELAANFRIFCDELNLNDDAGLLELMLVEAVNNIIEHAYNNISGSLVDAQFEADNKNITITLIDHGIYFPASVFNNGKPIPDKNRDLSEGNRGLGLIYTIADNVERYNVNGMNILVLVKNRN